jgi:hypothetical protein
LQVRDVSVKKKKKKKKEEEERKKEAFRLDHLVSVYLWSMDDDHHQSCMDLMIICKSFCGTIIVAYKLCIESHNWNLD